MFAPRCDYPEGVQCPMHVVHIKKKFFEFDGNKLHFTGPFQGCRFSLVYFVCEKFAKCNPSLRIDLRGHGFNFLCTNPQLQYMVFSVCSPPLYPPIYCIRYVLDSALLGGAFLLAVLQSVFLVCVRMCALYSSTAINLSWDRQNDRWIDR